MFFDNDTRLLFATAYDSGNWDTYMDDFVTKRFPSGRYGLAWDGWPGIRSPGAKDYLVKHHDGEGWYVAYPDLTVVAAHRAVDKLLDNRVKANRNKGCHSAAGKESINGKLPLAPRVGRNPGDPFSG